MLSLCDGSMCGYMNIKAYIYVKGGYSKIWMITKLGYHDPQSWYYVITVQSGILWTLKSEKERTPNLLGCGDYDR